ncbi:4-(cytidine 5'-diphospho)-2-C-methyl-D-erythritol kinase [Pseudooceanicola sp. 502str34]
MTDGTTATRREIARAKINLALHVTGQRGDGYHLLDSLVCFADFGDVLEVTPAPENSLTLDGPLAEGVPAGPENLVFRAASFFGQPAAIRLTKHLPMAAGIGGGTADAAAVLRALSAATGRPVPENAERLGADLPACLRSRALRMQGVGERLEDVPGLPPLPAVLVNPGLGVETPAVFKRLTRRTNPALPVRLPDWPDAASCAAWLSGQRNDLETPARDIAPVIGDVLEALAATPGCLLARMSGSGATCFALYPDRRAAEAAAASLAPTGWWARATTLS